MTIIDPNRPVYLLKMIINPQTGNVMPPLSRPYQPGSIPPQFLTPEYVSQKPAEMETGDDQKRLTPQSSDYIPERPMMPGGIKETNPILPSSLPPSEAVTIADPTEETSVNPSTPKTTLKPEQIKINSASAEVIASLDGVGEKTAAKILEVREKQQFSSLEDLDKRVPLPLNRKWTVYASQISFEG